MEGKCIYLCILHQGESIQYWYYNKNISMKAIPLQKLSSLFHKDKFPGYNYFFLWYQWIWSYYDIYWKLKIYLFILIFFVFITLHLNGATLDTFDIFCISSTKPTQLCCVVAATVSASTNWHISKEAHKKRIRIW